LKCDQLLWEEKQEENEETNITVSAYNVCLKELIELGSKLKKYHSLSRFVKLNLEHNVEKRESSFSGLEDNCCHKTSKKVIQCYICPLFPTHKHSLIATE